MRYYKMEIKTLKQAKERIEKLELIISWLTDGNNGRRN